MKFDDMITIGNVTKYRGNKIVRFLLEMSDTVDLNKIWRLTEEGLFDDNELREFYKMIGYTKGGYEELFE